MFLPLSGPDEGDQTPEDKDSAEKSSHQAEEDQGLVRLIVLVEQVAQGPLRRVEHRFKHRPRFAPHVGADSDHPCGADGDEHDAEDDQRPRDGDGGDQKSRAWDRTKHVAG